MALSHEHIVTQNPKYQQKSIPICSPEQNYLSLFAMRYPAPPRYIQKMALAVSIFQKVLSEQSLNVSLSIFHFISSEVHQNTCVAQGKMNSKNLVNDTQQYFLIIFTTSTYYEMNPYRRGFSWKIINELIRLLDKAKAIYLPKQSRTASTLFYISNGFGSTLQNLRLRVTN